MFFSDQLSSRFTSDPVILFLSLRQRCWNRQSLVILEVPSFSQLPSSLNSLVPFSFLNWGFPTRIICFDQIYPPVSSLQFLLYPLLHPHPHCRRFLPWGTWTILTIVWARWVLPSLSNFTSNMFAMWLTDSTWSHKQNEQEMRSMQVKMCISDTCYFWAALFYLVKLVSLKRIAKVKLTSGQEASEANVPAPVAITSSGFNLTIASSSNMFRNKLVHLPFPSRSSLITFWYLPFLSVWAQTISLLTKMLPYYSFSHPVHDFSWCNKRPLTSSYAAGLMLWPFILLCILGQEV